MHKSHIQILHKPTIKQLLRVICILAGSLGCGSHAADLSMLSDFGRPDITTTRFGDVTNLSNLVGVEQAGDLNVTSVQQSGGGKNNVQAWQQGTSLYLQANQSGTDNELRLSQSNDRSQGDLSQVGANNQMAIQQSGADNDVNGSQIGDSNALVLIQPGNSAFTFTQQGNQNQIQADLVQGQSIHVDQIGSQLSVQISPSN